MADKLYISVTDTSNIISCTINDSHQAQTSTAFINAINTNLTLGDHVTIYMGYEGNYKKRFTGYVKAIEVKEPEKFYSITCANKIENSKKEFLNKQLEEIKNMDKDSLKELYKETRKNGTTNKDSKGAGLGFIEMARKSTKPIEFNFEDIDEKHSFFSIKVTVKGE